MDDNKIRAMIESHERWLADNADGERADFSRQAIDHQGTLFTGVNLSYANFRYAYAFNTHFTNTNLTDTDFVGANLEYTYFSEANLTDANLTGANIRMANFMDCVVTRAKFEHLKFSNNILDNFNLGEVSLVGSIWMYH
jgi:uncharacterized protein YjbI with pentapeptide repeats